MALRVLIVQSEDKSAQTLSDLFAQRGDRTWRTTQPQEAASLIDQHIPDLLILDLHLPDDGWIGPLRHLRDQVPRSHIILTNRYPDLRRELLARDYGVSVFLREPFTEEWVERALQRLLEQPAAAPPPSLPRVATPVRIKITFPYAALALAFALAAAYLVNRFVLESIRDRFNNQLISVGQITADWMVREENRMLTSLRLLSHLQGLPEALTTGDLTRLRELALPVAVNYQEDAVEILSVQGQSLISLRHVAGGRVDDYVLNQGDDFSAWPFVQKVLAQATDAQGDKYAGLVRAQWGDYLYVAGPAFADDGALLGLIVIGKSVGTLAQEIQQDTQAHVTLYDLGGQMLATTLLLQAESLVIPPERVTLLIERQDREAWMRDFPVESVDHSEILGPWEARNGEDLGLIGVALAQNFLARPTLLTGIQTFVIVTLGFLAVVGVGLYVASRITQPLKQMVVASSEVARGNFEVKVTPSTDDEVAVLAHAFNYMVTGLQEGSIYRDLLGRTVSPEVRDQLRDLFASGSLKLEGQAAVATILMSDIRGFTTLSEQVEPTTILAWLNEYFGELVPVITARGGVVDKFAGDAILAFFGVLPKPLSPEESAYQACRAAVEMLRVIRRINARRQQRSEPLFVTGIGVNTGPVTAGSLGTHDRLNYTIIGDPVNTAQRLESFTRQFGESGAIISQHTMTALGERQKDFNLMPLGAHTFKGKAEPLAVYRLWPAHAPSREITRVGTSAGIR